MKVSELENSLIVGDVIIAKIDTNIFTGELLNKVGFVEMLVTWVRREHEHGPKDDQEDNNYDAILMDDNGEITYIGDLESLDDWEYSHYAFNKGAWRE